MLSAFWCVLASVGDEVDVRCCCWLRHERRQADRIESTVDTPVADVMTGRVAPIDLPL
nr:hypothetical protein [Kibdelosporangium sp. MJ126-NF4]CTQ89283.1 hypothetical protein [Kibdelosporangium sp. MJ126-NF4]